MKKRQSTRVALVAAVAVSAVLLNLTWAAGQQSPGGSTPSPVPDKQAILQQVQIESVPNALKAIAAAKEAIQAGHGEHALAELQKAEQALKVIQTSLAQYIGPKFANATCPIMGSPIDPDKVTENLTRTYKGQKVAFCCGGCPAVWDRLSDSEKEAKLKAVQSPKTGMQVHGSGHNH